VPYLGAVHGFDAVQVPGAYEAVLVQACGAEFFKGRFALVIATGRKEAEARCGDGGQENFLHSIPPGMFFRNIYKFWGKKGLVLLFYTTEFAVLGVKRPRFVFILTPVGLGYGPMLFME
jgi:hypothetical protein